MRSTGRSNSSAETCRRMDEAIAKNGPWLMGEQFTLADVLVMPSIDRMADLGSRRMSGKANIRDVERMV